jgi:ribosomal protein S18 acetylase RimI-like enzyme
MNTLDVTVRPVDEVPWSDAEAVFGTRGDPSTCWCQFFKLTDSEWNTQGAAGRAACLQSQTVAARDDGAATPGLIAYVDGEPAGWVGVEPRTHYPRALRGRVVTDGSSQSPDDDSVWAIVCFVVRVGFRRRGIAGALITAAVEHARSHGARMIEGYPVDTSERQKVSAAELYHGSVTLFTGAGFSVDARPLPGRALVTLRV